MTTATAMLTALRRHVAQRSGIDFRDYWTGDYWNARSDARAAFNADYRPMLREGRDARAMLTYLAMVAAYDAERVAAALRGAEMRRLTYNAERNQYDYVTGQYFPTEYRKAACALLARALRELGYDAEAARRAFGRGIASRWW